MPRAVLLVAYPGHDRLIHGWLSRSRPAVCVLTDGSGHSSAGRVSLTRDLVRSLHAREGPIFGRFADRDVYAAILDRNVEFLASLATELADFLVAQRTTALVTDAAAGYNPVHDLCGLIAGASCDL